MSTIISRQQRQALLEGVLAILDEYGLGQNQLARHFQIGSGTLSQILRRQTEARESTIRKMATGIESLVLDASTQRPVKPVEAKLLAVAKSILGSPDTPSEIDQRISHQKVGACRPDLSHSDFPLKEPEAVHAHWRQATVEQFIDAFLTLRSDDRKTKVAKVVGFAPDLDREPLGLFLDRYIWGFLDADAFNVESISLTVAEFDALRTDAAGQPEDLAVLTELQDLLLPLCIHPKIKTEVAKQMEDHRCAIINEAVALAIGAELCAASADGRQAHFRLDDEGRIAGEGLLSFVDAAIGDPKPEELVCQILHDLAEQLFVSLDDEIEDEPDVRKRITAWSNGLKLQVKAHSKRMKPRFYCVVTPPKNPALRSTLVELLTRVRAVVPEVVFFELHRRSPTKAAEEVVMQILTDRFKGEGQR